MAIKKIKPTTPGRRGMREDNFSDLTKRNPEKFLTKTLVQKSGRDESGKISIRRRGGGAKRKYRLISSLDERLGKEAKVLAIEYDPNRSARVALIQYENNDKAYIIAPVGLKVGSKIIAQDKAEIKIGNRVKLKNIPLGTSIYDVEFQPGSKGKIARSAGNYVKLVAYDEPYVHLRLPSSETRKVIGECFASIGSLSHPEHFLEKIGKAGKVRHMGKRPRVRGKAMNPVSHPHGGGEGGSPIGLKHPKTPWGKPTLGYRTRKKKKYSDNMIIKRRKKKNA